MGDCTADPSCSAKVLYVKGRQHPVKIYHTAVSQADYVDTAMRTFFQIHTDQPPGDVLIFLPGISACCTVLLDTSQLRSGQEDIESLEKSIELYAKRLPADAMAVSSLTPSTTHRFLTELCCTGDNLSSICCTSSIATVQDLSPNTQRHAEMYFGD